MKPPNWDRLQDIYHEALAKPESERSAFVANACGNDLDLLRQVNSLLKANDATGGILEAPVFEINAPENLVGQTIDGRYFIERELSPGGMSQVYLALNRRLQDQRVVIKVLSHELVQDSYARQKFEQEVEALLRIDHPNVVRVKDTGKLNDGTPYIVMAYVEGETLRSQITNDGMDLKRVASILKQIGAALTHVHEKGIFHRDLKPENIILTGGDDSVVLVDFGIAKVRDSRIAEPTVTGVSAGTLLYMSPEQLRGEEVGAAGDIYAMGLIAYEMITGRRLFKPSSAPHMLALQEKGLRKHLPEEVSAKAERVLRRALKFDPRARYQSASEFSDNLAHALLEPQVRPANPMRWAKVAGVLVILGLLGYGLYWILDGKDGPKNHSFTYSLMVQKVRDGQDYQEPFPSNGEETFENGYKFQLNVLTPVPAYLYIFRQGPSQSSDTNFTMIYPNRTTNDGAASLGANQPIQSEWMTFTGPAGDENFWMIWSLTPVPQLESAKIEALADPRGGLTGQTLVSVKEFLQTQPLATIYHYKADKTAKPRGKGDMLVALAQFKHR